MIARAMEIHIDPEFRDLIPPLSEEERLQLMANLLRDGCREPLVVWKERGIILDGNHRYEICEANELPYPTREIEFPDANAAKAWMIRNQFGRRNLTPFVRCELALKLEPLEKEKAKSRQKAAGGDRKSNGPKSVPPTLAEPIRSETRDELARVANVSHGTLDKAKLIIETAPKEVVDKVRSGDVSINQAFKDLKKSAEPTNPRVERESGPSGPLRILMEKVTKSIKAFCEANPQASVMIANELRTLAKRIER